MQNLNIQSAIQQWIVVLVLLLAIGLVGCGQDSTPQPTPTLSPTATPNVEPTPSPTVTVTPEPTLPPSPTPTLEPTPMPSPPETPVTEPTGEEVTVEVGKKTAIRASAAGADKYEWDLQGPGEISDPTKPAILYTAPEEGDTVAILTVTAYNDQGASLPTSLIINVPARTTRDVGLDALAIPVVWIVGRGDSESFIELEAGRNGCHTGSDCLRFTYRSGGEWGNVQWWPFCIGKIMEIRCQEAGEGGSVYPWPVCIAFVTRHTKEAVQESTCDINVLEAGNLSAVNRLTFWARGERGGEILTFSVGASDVPPKPGRSTGRITLTPIWQKHEIDLEHLDLTHAISLFSWYATDSDNAQGTVFYLDDIQFEGMRVEATQPPQNTNQDLGGLLTGLCWVAYSPTHFDPTTTRTQWPSEEDVREDLRVLRSAGFNGLVTYGSNYADQDAPDQMLDIPRLAQEAGFEGMIVGVWDPTDENELQAAEQTSHYPVVVGYSVGNEGLDVHYNLETLVSAMDRLRRNTGKPVSTTEEAHDYYEDSPLWSMSDWIFPNVHPYFAGYRDPEEAVEWTEKIFETLDLVSNKPLIFKEVGLPSGGDLNLDESRQAQYYQLLRETSVTYVVFEAFDAPWKHLGRQNPDGTYSWPDPEPHWGIFTSARVRKEAAINICSAQ